MTAERISQLDDDVLAPALAPGLVARARLLPLNRNVAITHRSPGKLKGHVRAGDGIQAVSVSWTTYGHFVDLYGHCTCRCGGSCVHVAALILAERSAGAGGDGPEWRRALAPVAQLADRTAAQERPLALRFTVTEAPQRGWIPDGVPRVLLQALPLTKGKTGRWIKSGASWRNLGERHPPPLSRFVPVQQQILAAMARSLPGHGYFPVPGPIDVADLGASLWPHLQLARQAGVELLDEDDRPGRVVLVEAPARFVVDLSRRPDGGVELCGAVVAGDVTVRLSAKQAGLIGEHGAFWQDDSGAVHLVRFEAPIPGELCALALRPPVTVPVADVEEFRATAGVRLARVTAVRADDPAIAPQIPDPPRLVLRVLPLADAQVRVTWGFRYGENPLQPFAYDPDRDRDLLAERRLVHEAQLDRLPVLRSVVLDRDARPNDATVAGGDFVDLVVTAVPWLDERGVEVDLADDLPVLREATSDPVIAIRVANDPETVDWYDLGVTVTIEGEKIAFAALFTALSQYHDRLLLPSGTWLRLDRPEFEQLRRLIEEARGLADLQCDPDRLRINRFQSDWWEEFAKLGVIERQSRRWSQAMRAMKSVTAADPVPVPEGIRATLRPYQRDGLAWLAWLHRHRLGGILADDMGLGKTVQGLALFAHVRQSHPAARFLVVAPTSVVSNWRRETERFAPDLGVVTISQTQARRGVTITEAAGDAAVVITSYTLLRLELEQYQELDWEIVVLDEAQFAKNRQSKLYQCVRSLDAASKVAMTGTPLENSLMDLWSLLSITAPGLYPDPGKFGEVYRRPIESGRAPDLLTRLRRRIAPLLRRRTKEQVLAELPPKFEQELAIEMSPQHRALYDRRLQRERQKVLGLLDDMDANRFQIFRSLTMLRQLAIDPALVSDEHHGVACAKLDHLVDQLTEAALEGHRALVFSQFTRFLTRVKDRLDQAGLGYAYLDGRTRNRAHVIDGFKNGDVPVFLISLKSGGFGLNLTEADYCFVLDPWWNPATELQAVDRTHRIGQNKPVMVYRYVSAGTIEEKVMELKTRKQRIFDSVVGDDDGALSGALTADDIKGLLG